MDKSWPSICIVPCVGRKFPATTLTRVDLPAPLSPISPTTWPGSSDSETSLRAWIAPKCFETFFSSRRAIPVFTLCGTDAAMRVSFLKRREQALNYRACGQVNDLDGSQVRTLASKIILHVVQRTKQSF